jgi:membrane-bound inhibitor of C-type lysozyme
MMSASSLVLIVCSVLLTSSALADNRVGFSCDDGHNFTITFLSAHNNQVARLVFDGSSAITMRNKGMASGIAYAGGGWHEWHGETTLVDMRSGSPKETACHEK